jgi:hypothetical protein
MALPIYGFFMQQLYANPKVNISKGDFEVPEGYENCRYNVFCINPEYDDRGDIRGSSPIPSDFSF